MTLHIETKQDLHKFRDALQLACDRLGIRLGKNNSHANAIAAALVGAKDYNQALSLLPHTHPKDEFTSRKVTLEDCLTLGSMRTASTLFSVDMLQDKTPRTLLYGETSERYAFHAYLESDMIHAVTYDKASKTMFSYIKETEANASLLSPTKYAYPALCDFEFCQILNTLLVQKIPFASFDGDDPRRKLKFVAEKASELSPIDPNCG